MPGTTKNTALLAPLLRWLLLYLRAHWSCSYEAKISFTSTVNGDVGNWRLGHRWDLVPRLALARFKRKGLGDDP